MKPDDRPNMLVIMTDQHARSASGVYGNSIVRTPNLDRLAREGMRFDRAYCPSPLCVPSRMSFMTSKTPSEIGVWHNRHVLHSGIPTWAHALTLAGYETSLIGRMHFIGPDQLHGFENRPIGERTAGHPGAPQKGGPFWQRFPSSTAGQSRESVEIAGRGHTFYQWQDEERTRAAVEYLENHQNAARPFAAVLGYSLPHCPFVAPKELFDFYYDRVDIPEFEQDVPATIRRFRIDRGFETPLPEERIRVARAAYFGLCEHIDRQIGEVMECLDRTRLSGRTLVVYVSDHGESAGAHGCWWKSQYYEESVGVPLIARLPGSIPAETMSGDICNLMDIGPTLADFANSTIPFPVQGRSLHTIMCDLDRPDREQETFSELADPRGDEIKPSRMIRSGPWKLWKFHDSAGLPPALFNLDDDPSEMKDLAEHPEFADVRNDLLERLYRDWDPTRVARIATERSEAFDVLTKWAKAVRPESPYMLAFPSAELEADVELL